MAHAELPSAAELVIRWRGRNLAPLGRAGFALSSRRPDRLTALGPTVRHGAEKKGDREARRRAAEHSYLPDRRWLTDPEGRPARSPHHPAPGRRGSRNPPP